MKTGKPEDNKIIVTVKTASRDAKTGKVKYATFESFDVYDAKPEQVYKVAYDAISKA